MKIRLLPSRLIYVLIHALVSGTGYRPGLLIRRSLATCRFESCQGYFPASSIVAKPAFSSTVEHGPDKTETFGSTPITPILTFHELLHDNYYITKDIFVVQQ